MKELLSVCGGGNDEGVCIIAMPLPAGRGWGSFFGVGGMGGVVVFVDITRAKRIFDEGGLRVLISCLRWERLYIYGACFGDGVICQIARMYIICCTSCGWRD